MQGNEKAGVFFFFFCGNKNGYEDGLTLYPAGNIAHRTPHTSGEISPHPCRAEAKGTSASTAVGRRYATSSKTGENDSNPRPRRG